MLDKKYLTYTVLICLLFLVPLSLHGQQEKFWVLDGQIRNFGFDFGFGKEMRAVEGPKTMSFGLRLGVVHHPKEIYVVNQSMPASEPFVMDKVNRVWAVRPYWGKGIQLKERKSRFDVGIQLQGQIETPMAYAWPIYLWIYRSNLPLEVIEEKRYKPDEQPVQLIGGESSYFRGFREGQWIPGLGFRGAIQMEWGSYKNITNNLSIGVMTDFFVKEIPLLYSLEKNPQILPALFINFAIGLKSEDPSNHAQ